MIIADSLVKRFSNQTVVKGVSFQVERGEVLGVLGPNGAGKSTTLRMLAGCLEPDGGQARLNGFDSALQRREAQTYLGYLPEGAPAYPSMTPLSYVRFCLRARGFSGSALKDAADHALERARMGKMAHKSISDLSKGYKRRAALAAAIAHDPPILILDEPTDGLDPNQKDAVRALMAEMAPKKAIIISTHLLDEVETMCSRAIVIADGEVRANASPHELMHLGREVSLASAFRTLTAPTEPLHTPSQICHHGDGS
ncbi:ABC transporter ATP-binding protein [Woodsholea maritima]|uniref:ABC transporter ATP-binding protein n=1 Tax=Woodsholea maritima TaxID=240237 RepID=UPI000364397B|nr:ABC transporter ATP-binding protein [Woodsholea maritima]